MKETSLSEPAAQWLKDHGYTVYTEVPAFGSASHIDLVGRRKRELCCIELKTGWTKHLFHQCIRHHLITTQVWACSQASPSKRSKELFHSQGIGMLRIEMGQAVVMRKPKLKFDPVVWYAEKIHEYLNRMEPGGEGGKPNVKGEGPAREARKAIDLYLVSHPKATWQELWENVPNHYVSARSMYGAMRTQAERDGHRERMKEARLKREASEAKRAKWRENRNISTEQAKKESE